MQKGGEGVQIACKIAYVLNGRPLNRTLNPSSFEEKTRCNIGRIICVACTFYLCWPSYSMQSEENAKFNKGFSLYGTCGCHPVEV